jgi:hypothetical protein
VKPKKESFPDDLEAAIARASPQQLEKQRGQAKHSGVDGIGKYHQVKQKGGGRSVQLPLCDCNAAAMLKILAHDHTEFQIAPAYEQSHKQHRLKY